MKTTESVTVRLLGQKFLVEHQNGHTFISHPKWSLVGSGPLYDDALKDLFKECADTVRAYSNQPAAALSKSTRDMLKFAERVGRMAR